MQATSKNIAKALMQSLSDGTDPEKLAKSFEKYLSENHLLGLVPNIIANLEREQMKVEKGKTADIRTSHELAGSIVKDIEKRIRKESGDATKVTVDPELIGGFKAVYKGKVFDASVRNYLKELREELVK